MDAIAAQVVSLAVAAAFGVVTGFLGARLRRITQRDQAIEKAVGALIRNELMEAFELHVVNGAPVTVERRRVVDECYKAYEALGLNDVGRSMYERVRALKIEI